MTNKTPLPEIIDLTGPQALLVNYNGLWVPQSQSQEVDEAESGDFPEIQLLGKHLFTKPVLVAVFNISLL